MVVLSWGRGKAPTYDEITVYGDASIRIDSEAILRSLRDPVPIFNRMLDDICSTTTKKVLTNGLESGIIGQL
jgi:hypothetical protein